VRPHPRVAMEKLTPFAGPNVKFTWQPTAELIPLCDLYVASISATIRWALACGIPVINYDTYRYRYCDYDAAPGLVSVESLQEFQQVLTRFVEDPLFAAELAERQTAAMGQWGILDDKLEDRFAALACKVIGESRAKFSVR
jgi:hypothetical protein